MLACFLGGVALHADRLPLLYVAVPVLTCLWRALAEARLDVRLPAPWIRGVLAIGLLAGVLVQYRTVNGLIPGTALLVATGSVKLLETRSRRDRYIMVAVALFLMLSACLDRQSMLRAPLYLLLTWACCVAFVYVAHADLQLPSRDAIRLAGRALAASLPLALVMFVFFPRLPGQLWALPSQGSATTGLGDEMTPGGISNLSESDEPAFRVRFLGAPPAPEQRYWRGPVLHSFDGYTWRRDRSQTYRQIPLDLSGTLWRYRITLEPHQRNWLFSLETLEGPPSESTFLTYDRQLLSAQPITQPVTYQLRSYSRATAAEPLTALGRKIETALPQERNPRTLELARQLWAQTGTPSSYAEAVLARFRDGGFVYTLTPELLQRDSVDDFLFNTRAGFCGHYASAFVTLMRAAGIPARVVTGYLGGEWNSIGGYFIVRQSDAHAWAEIWDEGTGWRRVDPTAVVSPERLTRGLLDILPEAGTQAQRFVYGVEWLQAMRQRWDAANTWWRDNIQDFNARSQNSLLRWLGFDAPRMRQLGWIAAAALALWILAMFLWFVQRGPARPGDALGRGYQRLCRWLSRRGLQRRPFEGPTRLRERLAAERPDLAPRVAALVDEYAELRYGATDERERRLRTRRWLRDVRRLPFAA
jgi:transglutaminase-like putative cysteine protease